METHRDAEERQEEVESFFKASADFTFADSFPFCPVSESILQVGVMYKRFIFPNL